MDVTKWVDKFCVDVALKYNSPATQKTYLSCVRLFLSRFANYDQPQRIPTHEIKQWLLEATTLSTRKHRLCAVNSFYRLTVGMPLKTGKIPYPKREKKLPRIIDNEILKAKIEAVKNIKHRALLSIGYCCALRVSEVVNLKLSDIDGKQGLVLIRNGKGGKDRYTAISQSVLSLLRVYFRQYRPKVYLFEGQYSGQYTTKSCEGVYHTHIEKQTSWHNLRHSAITFMIESGTNILAIGSAVGHNNPKTTSIYFHTSKKFISSLSTPI